jgi:hypothetical protein
MKKSNKETAAYFIEKVIKLQEDAMLIGESRNKQIQNIKVNKFIEDLAFL